MSPRVERTILSVGLNMKYAGNRELSAAKLWLEFQKNISPQSDLLVKHIQELEALIGVEGHSSLSRMADDMRSHLEEIRPNHTHRYSAGYQLAINLVIDKMGDIDLESNCATSITEIQAATIRDVQKLCVNTDDYQAVGDYAKAIEDGAK